MIVHFADESLNSTGYESWANNEPNATPGEDCGVFGNFSSKKYGLGDFLCSINLPYICEEETVAKLKSISTPEKDGQQQEGRFLEGYELVPGMGYYKYHLERVIWDEAVDVCAREGGHLLILNSKEEEKALRPLYVRDQFSWIGVHYQYEEGKYVTIFSKYCISNM